MNTAIACGLIIKSIYGVPITMSCDCHRLADGQVKIVCIDAQPESWIKDHYQMNAFTITTTDSPVVRFPKEKRELLK